MNTLAKKRRSRFACLALIGLTLGTVLAGASTASAQYGRGGREFREEYRERFGNRGYGYGGGFNRGYGYGGGYNRGFGYGGGYAPGFYNRGYGGSGYGNGFYNRGYGGGLNIGIGVPIAPQVYTPAYGYGGYGGYY